MKAKFGVCLIYLPLLNELISHVARIHWQIHIFYYKDQGGKVRTISDIFVTHTE